MKTTQQEIIAGLDMGTTQFRVAIGKCYEEGIEIIGVGQNPSTCMRKGEVVNLDSAATAIRKAVNEAELMAGCKIRNVVVGIASRTIRSRNSHAEVLVNQGEVSEQDIRGVLESARTIQLPPDHEILHIIPCEFIIDKQTRTSQPLGLTGSTLEAKLLIVTVESASIKNIVNACKLAGLKEFNIVLQSLATAETALLPEEREQGVLHIDIGGGPAKIAVFSNGSMGLYKRFWVVSSQLTNDVAVNLRISMVQAEQVKQLHGCCLENMVDSNFKVEVVPSKDNGTRLLSRTVFAQIIGPRMDEVFSLIAEEMQKSGYDGELATGAVITGGTSLLMGMEELAKQVLNMPVRIGTPGTIEGLVDSVSQPHHSTAVGLVLLGARKDGVPQGIKAGGGKSLVLRATMAIQRVMRKFDKSANPVVTRSCYTREYPLFYAVACRDEAEARRLLADGADPNERTAYGTTPLMQSVYGCSLGMIADLLTAGADPLLQDKRGYTVLVHALQRRDSGTVDIFQLMSGLIADHPLDCNGYRLEDHVMMRVLRHKNAGCDVPFAVAHVALTEAAIEGDCKRLAEFLSDEIPQRIFTNAMVLASERGHLMCVRTLVDKHADANGRSVYGSDPLGVAAAGLYPELVKYLIAAGSKVETRNEAGETPLHEACTYMALDRTSRRTFEQRLVDQVETARILLDAGVDVNMCSDRGRTPIGEVVFTARNPALVRLLLERGAIPPPLKDAYGNELVMLASLCKDDILEILKQ